MQNFTSIDAQKDESSGVAHAFLFIVRRPEYDNQRVSCLTCLGLCTHAHVQQLPWDVSLSNLPNKMSISSLIYSGWLFVCTRVNY